MSKNGKLTLICGEEASRAIEKIQILTGKDTPQKAVQISLGTQLYLSEHIAQGYEVRLYKRGRAVKALDFSGS